MLWPSGTLLCLIRGQSLSSDLKIDHGQLVAVHAACSAAGIRLPCQQHNPVQIIMWLWTERLVRPGC